LGLKFRDLRADEIECRVGTVSQSGKGISLLLYKTARTDCDILDETVGPENWQCRFYECKGTLFCSLGIRIAREDGSFEWVWKDDAGSPSNMEAQKGEASDCRKRSGFAWNIGRELYTAPFIWVPADKCNVKQGKNGKWTCYDRFRVAKVAIEGGRIRGLRIVNAKTGAIAFSWKEG
jgi:hypothetical protein